MSQSERVYRVDQFVVPEAARDEFLSRVRQTHALLRAQPGFVQDFVLEQSWGQGSFNFVTIVEWANEAVVEQARAAVTKMQARANFNPQELFARLGIKPDLGYYRRVDAWERCRRA